MDNFTVTDEIELTDELLGAVFGATGGTNDSYDYNQIAKNSQSNTADVGQNTATIGSKDTYVANWSSIDQSNKNSQKLWYYWY